MLSNKMIVAYIKYNIHGFEHKRLYDMIIWQSVSQTKIVIYLI